MPRVSARGLLKPNKKNMWQSIEFNTREQLNDWIDQWGHRTRWNEIFINNGYGVEYMRLRSI